MTSGARVLLRYRDLDIPTSWEEAPPGARASRPQPYSCKQPAIQGHSLEQCTKPAFAGFATLVPSPMRAGRPRSRVRPARNLIRASSLRSRGIPSNSAPNPPLQGSLLWCQVLCGRDARAPGCVPPATLFVPAACDPGAFPRTVHQTRLCRVRYFGAKSYAGGTPALPGASRPQPYSCQQPAIQGHSFEQCTKPAFAGFATLVPSPMRARRPRSRVGVLPFTLAPQESVSGCRAAALPCRSCERASCNIGSGTGHFAGNRDVLPISIVGCDLVIKGSSPQKAQKSQNEFREFES